MAADMALQVVVSLFLGVVFDSLGSLICIEVGLVWGVDKEMKKLASTLSTVRDVLEDAEEKQVTEKAVINWLLKLRDLAYDADDILDEWETEARELKLKDVAHLSRTNAAVKFASTIALPNSSQRGNRKIKVFDSGAPEGTGKQISKTLGKVFGCGSVHSTLSRREVS